MIKKMCCLGLFLMFMSCTLSIEDAVVVAKIHSYVYSDNEFDLMQSINKYRESKGLSRLLVIDHISYLSAQHNQCMIQKKSVSHNGFVQRSNELLQLYGAIDVGENVAYNFSSNKGVLDAWINSPSHKKILEGNFTHFGLSIAKDTISGENYFTNIYIKKTQ